MSSPQKHPQTPPSSSHPAASPVPLLDPATTAHTQSSPSRIPPPVAPVAPVAHTDGQHLPPVKVQRLSLAHSSPAAPTALGAPGGGGGGVAAAADADPDHDADARRANDDTTQAPDEIHANAVTHAPAVPQQPQTQQQQQKQHHQQTESVASRQSRSPSPSPSHSRPPSGAFRKRDVRRAWNRKALENSGISADLLAAYDNFVRDIPPIPTTTDLSRKTPVRNMRKWIADLETHQYASLWAALINVLAVDKSLVDAWGDEWDHDLCRFILGVLVSEDQTKNRTDKRQSRQAVNNAIKRELATPIESGSSSRSKTFRDLFREKCQAAGVSLPSLIRTTPPAATSQISSQPSQSQEQHRTTTPPSSQAHSAPARPTRRTHLLPVLAPAIDLPSNQSKWPLIMPKGKSTRLYTPAVGRMDDQLRLSSNKSTNLKKRKFPGDALTLPPSLPTIPTILPTAPATLLPYEQFLDLRKMCGTDEWDRTAWWEIPFPLDDLPALLAAYALSDLRHLLLDFRWIRRTFQSADFSGMRQVSTQGYDLLLEMARHNRDRFPAVEIEGFRLIRNALMVITPILANDSTVDPVDETGGNRVVSKYRFDSFIAHLATQLVGRLLNLKRRFPVIGTLLQSTELYAPRPWLRPLNPCFQEPRTDIKIAVPSNGTFTPHLIVLSHDGTLLAASGARIAVVSVSKSIAAATLTSTGKVATEARSMRKVSSIRLWDVETGKSVGLVDNIPSLVRCLALARDHSCVIAETVDGLFFWAMQKKGDKYEIAEPVEATPRPKSVTSITPTIGSHGVLTTSKSDTEVAITLWGTETGMPMRSFSSVKSRATCTDVSLDGEYFASGHNNGFIHLWNFASNDSEPVLSFKNEGAVAESGQQHVGLSRVNEVADSRTLKTISVSFYEKKNESLLAAVSGNQIMRVWELPPRSITRESKLFVSSILRAVLRCPCVRDVQWSQWGWFFSAGDDGIARMWLRREDGSWGHHAIGRAKRERSSEISAVLVSCGKGTRLVATYVTKSPYVTVWDMSGFVGKESEVKRRGSLYRNYMCMVGESVDASDIVHLTGLEKIAQEGVGGMMQNGMGNGNGKSKGMGEYGYRDNVSWIRTELQERFIHKLDLKNATKLVGDMNPRLTMQPDGWGPRLEVCFEQPVILGVSGTFRRDSRAGAGKIGVDAQAKDAAGVPGEFVGNADDGEEVRRGMVAALQDGAIAMFELEGWRRSLSSERLVYAEAKKEERKLVGEEESTDADREEGNVEVSNSKAGTGKGKGGKGSGKKVDEKVGGGSDKK